jgi:hypothetical protein
MSAYPMPLTLVKDPPIVLLGAGAVPLDDDAAVRAGDEQDVRCLAPDGRPNRA